MREPDENGVRCGNQVVEERGLKLSTDGKCLDKAEG
jgi:hypothetical protein